MRWLAGGSDCRGAKFRSGKETKQGETGRWERKDTDGNGDIQIQ